MTGAHTMTGAQHTDRPSEGEPAMTSADALILRGVRLRLPAQAGGDDAPPPLDIALDVEIPPGTILTVMGASGSGKSTLLNYVAGFLGDAFEAEGQVLLGARDVTAAPPEERRIGLLFQDPLLFPHLSVLGNLLFGMPQSAPGADPRHARRARAEAALEESGLSGFGARDPETLSGGQKARVALLRLLLSEPKAALLDEPFSKLDAERRAEIRSLTFARLRAAGLPAILVTHDPEDAAAADGPVVRLAGG